MISFGDGKTTKVGPGSVMFTAPNDLHGIVNTGKTPLVFTSSSGKPRGRIDRGHRVALQGFTLKAHLASRKLLVRDDTIVLAAQEGRPLIFRLQVSRRPNVLKGLRAGRATVRFVPRESVVHLGLQQEGWCSIASSYFAGHSLPTRFEGGL